VLLRQVDKIKTLRYCIGFKMMRKYKIVVLKTMFNEDLAKGYGVEGLKKCPFHKVGQFFSTYAKSEGFCAKVWEVIYQYVFAGVPVIFLRKLFFKETVV
jgi:hypothetical protein